MFGKIKAKDVYQKIAMDSMLHNTLTVVRGPAGTGKSLLSLGYLFDRLEKGKIDRIIIFCNTVAT
jgi:phosphate starvation-inducible protein PhoH